MCVNCKFVITHSSVFFFVLFCFFFFSFFRATDKDSGENGIVRYTLIGGNAQGQFAVDSLNGDLSVVDRLDFETAKNYRLIVRAQDGGVPSKSNTTQVLVEVSDVNDNEPRFFAGAFHETIQENVPVGYTVLVVKVRVAF